MGRFMVDLFYNTPPPVIPLHPMAADVFHQGRVVNGAMEHKVHRLGHGQLLTGGGKFCLIRQRQVEGQTGQCPRQT